jgi:hypothetical protein
VGFYLATDTHALTSCDGVSWSATLNASGNVACIFDSTANTQNCYDSSGNAFTSVKGLANPSDTNVVNYISPDGVQHRIAQSGGSTVTAGTFAALPSCSVAGATYLFTDSFYDSALCGGSTYTYFLNGRAMVPPDVAATFTSVNMSTATYSATNGPGVIKNPSDVSFSVKSRVTAKPGTATWHVILGFRQSLGTAGTVGSNTLIGICTRESGTGKEDIFGLFQTSAGLVGFAMTNPTTFSSVTFVNGSGTPTINLSIYGQQLIYLRVGEGGGNRTWDYSPDGGLSWTNILTEAVNTRFTLDQVGYFVNGAATEIIALTWEVTS